MDTELHGRITLHLGISSFGAFYFAFVLPENLKQVWQRHESIVWYSAKGYAKAESFHAFLTRHPNFRHLRGNRKISILLDQDQYRRSVVSKAEHLGKFNFLFLPPGTTKHAQPIDQFIHKNLKSRFKTYDFRVSLPQIVEEIKAKLQRESIIQSWHLVRRKFPRGSEITRTLPKRRRVTGPH
jgi:DDE superfamily endonuclease